MTVQKIARTTSTMFLIAASSLGVLFGVIIGTNIVITTMLKAFGTLH